MNLPENPFCYPPIALSISRFKEEKSSSAEIESRTNVKLVLFVW